MRGILAVLFLVGCGASPAQQRESRLADDEARIKDEARAQLVSPTCRDDGRKWKACGLIADRYLTDSATAEFATKQCHGSVDDACVAAYKQAFVDDLRARYDLAPMSEVIAKCNLVDCSRWQLLELAWLELHNERAYAGAVSKMDDRAKQHEKDASETTAAQDAARVIGGALGGALRARQESERQRGQCQRSTDCSPGYTCLVDEKGRGTCAQPR